jgi:hypothetical protein
MDSELTGEPEILHSKIGRVYTKTEVFWLPELDGYLTAQVYSLQAALKVAYIYRQNRQVIISQDCYKFTVSISPEGRGF